jgi:uncharacterized protein
MPVVERVELPSPAPGTRRHLLVHRFGRAGARPKAYLQAALHADELPGVVVLGHLLERLARLEADGLVRGEVVVVPAANPIGLAQAVMGYHLGRYDLALMTNFNRGWPDLADALAERVGEALGGDEAANGALVRQALAELARELPVAGGENAALRRELFCAAADADLVLDLHCDSEAVTHLYLGAPLWPDAEDLARDIGSEATLLAEVSGGDPFDEAFSRHWWELRRRFPDRPLPRPGCLAATLEYRGVADVGGARAAADAEGLARFLTRRGVLAGDPGPLPPLPAGATPLAGVAMVRAPVAGVVDHAAEPGARVAVGDLLATLLDPLAGGDGPPQRTEVRSPVAGVVFARETVRLARPGTILAKVAGAEPLPERTGPLLTD